ncbi:MAG: hypothetical protein DRP29_04835 [Thermodesulfobacteriota bacterium]|nr:MAG: hypothetical protein DRP29_04835 [Thermodesulfobacteriota bacterium]RLG12959.1 MAG: hypothetical protein DRN73_00765 [Candidatus Pacearchaeota archaeon]
MRRKLKLLNLLTRYKELKEEEIKNKVFICRMNLEKILKEKEEISKRKKECYKHIQNKKFLTGEELKNLLFEKDRCLELEKISEEKIKEQKEELESFLKLLENVHKEKRLMENLYEKNYRFWLSEQERKILKEIDDLVLLKRGREIE